MLMMLALAGLGLLVALGFALRLAVPALGRLLLPVSLSSALEMRMTGVGNRPNTSGTRWRA